MEKTLQYWPILVFLIGLGVAQGRNEMQMSAFAEDISDNETLVEQNRELLLRLQQADIRAEGQVKLEIQRLGSNVAALQGQQQTLEEQNDALQTQNEQIIRLLERLTP